MTLCITAAMAEILAQFGAEAVGQLTLAMLAYLQGGELPDLTGEARWGWVPLRQALDAQIEAHERKAAAGRAGGRPRTGTQAVENPVEKPVENQPQPVDNDTDQPLTTAEKAEESRKKQTKAELLPAPYVRAEDTTVYLVPLRERERDLVQPGLDTSSMEYCPSLPQDIWQWWHEIDPEERQLDQLAVWLDKHGRKYTRDQLNAALTVVERKALGGRLRDPLAYLISLCVDWERRGLRRHAQIAEYLDLTPGPSIQAQRAAEA